MCPYRQEDSPHRDIPLEWLVSICSLTHTLKPLSLCCPQPGSGCHPRGPSHCGHCDTGAGCSSYGQEKSDCEEAAHCRNLRWVCKGATGFGHLYKFSWVQVSLTLIFILSFYYFNCFITYLLFQYKNVYLILEYAYWAWATHSNLNATSCSSPFSLTLVTVMWSGAVVF